MSNNNRPNFDFDVDPNSLEDLGEFIKELDDQELRELDLEPESSNTAQVGDTPAGTNIARVEVTSGRQLNQRTSEVLNQIFEEGKDWLDYTLTWFRWRTAERSDLDIREMETKHLHHASRMMYNNFAAAYGLPTVGNVRESEAMHRRARENPQLTFKKIVLLLRELCSRQDLDGNLARQHRDIITYMVDAYFQLRDSTLTWNLPPNRSRVQAEQRRVERPNNRPNAEEERRQIDRATEIIREQRSNDNPTGLTPEQIREEFSERPRNRPPQRNKKKKKKSKKKKQPNPPPEPEKKPEDIVGTIGKRRMIVGRGNK